jgi:hypothetical protein
MREGLDKSRYFWAARQVFCPSCRSGNTPLNDRREPAESCPLLEPAIIPTLGTEDSFLKHFEITGNNDGSMDKAPAIAKDELTASFGRAPPGCPNCYAEMVMACREAEPAEPIIFTFQCRICRSVLQRAKATDALSI